MCSNWIIHIKTRIKFRNLLSGTTDADTRDCLVSTAFDTVALVPVVPTYSGTDRYAPLLHCRRSYALSTGPPLSRVIDRRRIPSRLSFPTHTATKVVLYGTDAERDRPEIQSVAVGTNNLFSPRAVTRNARIALNRVRIRLYPLCFSSFRKYPARLWTVVEHDFSLVGYQPLYRYNIIIHFRYVFPFGYYSSEVTSRKCSSRHFLFCFVEVNTYNYLS